MDLRLDWKILIAIAFTLLTAPALVSANPCQPEPTSIAGQQLAECLKLAKDGDVQAAFEKAKQTKSLYGQERMFDVSYVNTLVSIVGSENSDVDVSIINEAISTVNAARHTKIYDGDGDAEVAFHFMNSLAKLSGVVAEISEPIAGKIRVYEGQIAQKLRSNVSYPRNAMEALAKPMIDMAQGYAERKEVELTFGAINSAINCGYGDYRKLNDEEWFTSLIDAGTAESWMSSFDANYAIAIDRWSRQVVSEFQGASFEFSLNDVDGSLISKADYTGKILVVDLWATWCPPCRKGIPEFIDLQRKYKKDGVAVLGISMDAPENPAKTKETVRNFAKSKNVNYDIALGDTTVSGQLAGKMALPTTLFLDRTGRVRYVAKGYHDYAKVQAITKVLLSESQPISSSQQQPALNY